MVTAAAPTSTTPGVKATTTPGTAAAKRFEIEIPPAVPTTTTPGTAAAKPRFEIYLNVEQAAAAAARHAKAAASP